MIDLSKYSEVIFDCDGVILDSNKVKSEAFALALPEEDKMLVDDFVLYHKENGGISRFVKFVYFFEVIKGQKNYQEDLEKALKRYAELSFQGLLQCKEIKGVRKTLKKLNHMGVNCYVTSGGEQGEVRKVLSIRSFSDYFKGIYGSPASKEENLKRIPLTKALYFGDAASDHRAANHMGIDFVYISDASEWSDGITFCKDNQLQFARNFEEVV